MRKILELSLADLQTVALRCPACHTRVLLDLAHVALVGARTSFAPRQCPSCETKFDTALEQLEAFERAWRALSKVAPETIVFQVSGDALESS